MTALPLGTLAMVDASGCKLAPTARNLVVIIAHGEGIDFGRKYRVRPICRCSQTMPNIRDRDRRSSELTPLSAYGMRVDRIETTVNGFNLLHLDRDPDIDPQHPWGWEVPWGGFGYLDMRTDVDDAALPFIAVPQAMREAA